MCQHSWKTTGWRAALLKRTCRLLWTLGQAWASFVLSLSMQETGADLYEVKLCSLCCWDCSWNIVSWFWLPKKMLRDWRESSRYLSRWLGPRAALQKLCGKTAGLSLMKQRLRGNLLIVYNCMKKLKDSRANLFLATAGYKIRGRGQNLQLETFKWHSRKYFFTKRVVQHWSKLFLETMAVFGSFSYLAT